LIRSEDPLILSFSPQARLGVLAIESNHIRKRIWLGEGTALRGTAPKRFTEHATTSSLPLGRETE
jgi:hypothetical protein